MLVGGQGGSSFCGKKGDSLRYRRGGGDLRGRNHLSGRNLLRCSAAVGWALCHWRVSHLQAQGGYPVRVTALLENKVEFGPFQDAIGSVIQGG